jgi:hypothetical protein
MESHPVEGKEQGRGSDTVLPDTALIDLRRRVVSEFAKSVAEGRVFLSMDQARWRPQDVELISSTAGRLIKDLSDYVSGTVAGEEFEFLEKQLFFSISVLRTYNALKTNLDEAKVEADIHRLESKIDKIDSYLSTLVKPKQTTTSSSNTDNLTEVKRAISSDETLVAPQVRKSRERGARETTTTIEKSSKIQGESVVSELGEEGLF